MTTRNRVASRPDRTDWVKMAGAEALVNAVFHERAVKARSDVLLQGEIPKVAHVLLEGHTYRYRLLTDGRRQITAVLMPGEVCDLEAAMRGRADYGVGALTDCVLGEISLFKIADPTTVEPEMARTLWRRLLRDEAIAREWLVGLGCRTALERVAHLLCELWFRLRAIDLTSNDTLMRLTQAELGALLGLSIVHVNRVLQELRRTGLIEVLASRMSILDVPALEKLAGFDPAYLGAH